LLPELDLDPGTLVRQTSPPCGPVGNIHLWPELYIPGWLPAALGTPDAITPADKAEFEIIKKMPVLDRKHHSFTSVSNYVAFRTTYFGAPADYVAFAAESDNELANTQWTSGKKKKKTRTLRSMIEFNKEPRKQQIFYRWVRKAYKRKYGNDVNVPELIKRGMSQELADAIAEVRGSVRVKKAHEQDFHAGGFNPRPIKYLHHYLLGTLSEHATGLAVDIDDTKNPQLSPDEWKFIEGLIGKKVKLSGRWKTEADAEGLWKDVKEASDLFVTKVASEVKRIEKERAEKEKAEKEKAEKEKAAKAPEKAPAKPAHPAKPHKVLTPLEEVLGQHFKSLSPWATSGFFHIPLELFLELHAHGFKWGAAFGSNVDLHHFELPEHDKEEDD
jgi:hypothetical protein